MRIPLNDLAEMIADAIGRLGERMGKLEKRVRPAQLEARPSLELRRDGVVMGADLVRVANAQLEAVVGILEGLAARDRALQERVSTLEEMAMADQFDSGADQRVENTGGNSMRHSYRVLSEAEKAQMQRIKDMGESFVMALHELGGTPIGSEALASRDLALARTHIEDAVMRAVRHLTSG